MNIDDNVKAAKDEHIEAKAFLLALEKNMISDAKKYLLGKNKGPQLEIESRTLITIDATCSMYMLLEKTKSTVSVMFKRAFKIMMDNNIKSGFQIQIAFYRNYNSPVKELLQFSAWESKAEGLLKFMKSIEVAGGYGNEAVEIALWYANQQAKTDEGLSQVILIGDAPPNTQNEVHEKRKYRDGYFRGFTGSYWEKTEFKKPTYYETELKKLAEEKIPVHTFHLQTRAAKAFQHIAKATGGTNSVLDIDSPDGSKDLTDLVTQEILQNVGGEKGDKLVNDYRKRYMKSHNR